MPYENEFSCRLNPPDKYIRIRRKNCDQKSSEKCIDVIYGVREDGKSEIQSLRFPKSIWNKDQAREYCRKRRGFFEA